MYIAPWQGLTTPRGQNFDVNRNLLSLQSYVASFKKSLWSLILYNKFSLAGADSPQGTKFWCQQICLVTSFICCKFKKYVCEVWFCSSFYACPHYLQVWQNPFNQRWVRKAGDIIFSQLKGRNSKMTGQIRPEFEPDRDFMPVLISCKFNEVWIHSNWEKMETPFSPFKINGNAQGPIFP